MQTFGLFLGLNNGQTTCLQHHNIELVLKRQVGLQGDRIEGLTFLTFFRKGYVELGVLTVTK